MQLSFKTAWLKVGVEVDGVTVGFLLTDTQEWVPMPVFTALTQHERASIFAALEQQHMLSASSTRRLTDIWAAT